MVNMEIKKEIINWNVEFKLWIYLLAGILTESPLLIAPIDYFDLVFHILLVKDFFDIGSNWLDYGPSYIQFIF